MDNNELCDIIELFEDDATMVDFSDLEGLTITKVVMSEMDDHNTILMFYADNGMIYGQFHPQSCCESVRLEDTPTQEQLESICGSPVLVAEERSNKAKVEYGVSEWTFYTIRTNKATLDLRWYGESNGYYSTSVSMYVLPATHEA